MSYAERFTQTHKVEYQDAARLAIQNQTSVLRMTVSESPMEGERSSPVTYYDKVKAKRREGRVPSNSDNPANRRRRWLMYQPTFDSSEYIDSSDKFQGMTNFQSPLMMTHTSAVRRFVDEDVILNGLFGDAFEGELGGTTIALPASQVIGKTVQAGAGTGSVGMNLEKIKASRKKFAANGHDFAIEEPYMLLTAEQIDDLSNEIELTSTDYRQEAGPQFSRDGKLSKVWNHWIIEFQNLPTRVSGADVLQRIPAYCKSGVHLGVWKDVTFDAYPDPSKFNELFMVASANMDCRRLDEKLVVEIECKIG